MLKTIDPLIGADLLWILASMGHGDQLALVDRNFPAQSVALATRTGKLVRLDGTDCAAAAAAILQLFPLDTFTDEPIVHMQVVAAPERVLDVHHDVLAACNAAEGRTIRMGSLERHAFYAQARQAYAVVQTTERRPYGCFLLSKGVI